MSVAIKISIIIPIHNTPVEYLKECLESIINQTFLEWEMILIDDCSDDEGVKICLNDYSKTDKRILLITLDKTSGAAVARNVGLDKSKGEAVIFLDSDDVFSDRLLEEVWGAYEDTDADVVIFNTGLLVEGIKKEWSKDVIPIGEFSLENLPDSGLADCGLVPWNKLIRKKFLVSNKIEFQSLTSCNDVYFSAMTYVHAKKIFHLNSKALVFWRENRPGQINQNRNPVNLYLAVKKILEEDISYDLYPKVQRILIRQGVPELRKSKKEEWSKLFYDNVVKFLVEAGENIFSNFDDERLAQMYKKYTFESKWWELDNVYVSQLSLCFDDGILWFDNLDNTILWGCGKRGRAFLEIVKERCLSIKGIYDKNEELAKHIAVEYHVEYCSRQKTNEVNRIIASNHNIWSVVKDIYPEIEVIDLEQYCKDL